MAKKKQEIFFCKSCGFESVKWAGQCPSCGEWNSFVEGLPKAKNDGRVKNAFAGTNSVKKISEIKFDESIRIKSGIEEMDRVLGGGIVSGSLTLVGGDPGIGKSTLLLQMCKNIGDAGLKVLYVSGEESLSQIKLRADRIGEFNDNMMLFCETSLDEVVDVINDNKPSVVIIDSIQTMYNDSVASAMGSVSQIRETTAVLLSVAKQNNIAIFIVGHVTKEGTVAGPRVLEHMVDTVLYLEGDRYASYRILRGVKNRFGSTNEIGVFEMTKEGMREVKDPSQYMLNGKPENAAGSVVSCLMEGTRPILVEVQALCCRTSFGLPRRTANGTDINRVNLLMAVLEKRMNLHMGDCDAYINIAGGMKVVEPAMDLGIVMAVVSSFKNIPISDDTVCFGEVGLSGEVRAVSNVEQRVNEAQKMGFKTVIIPRVSADRIKNMSIKIIGISNVKEAIELI